MFSRGICLLQVLVVLNFLQFVQSEQIHKWRMSTNLNIDGFTLFNFLKDSWLYAYSLTLRHLNSSVSFCVIIKKIWYLLTHALYISIKISEVHKYLNDQSVKMSSCQHHYFPARWKMYCRFRNATTSQFGLLAEVPGGLHHPKAL